VNSAVWFPVKLFSQATANIPPPELYNRIEKIPLIVKLSLSPKKKPPDPIGGLYEPWNETIYRV
jgi:hypothetical protein